jgi:hypothetical protein
MGLSKKPGVVPPDFNSLLVVGASGRIRQLFTPIWIQCTEDGYSIQKGSWVYAEAIAFHPLYRLQFYVHDSFYPYHIFRLL